MSKLEEAVVEVDRCKVRISMNYSIPYSIDRMRWKIQWRECKIISIDWILRY